MYHSWRSIRPPWPCAALHSTSLHFLQLDWLPLERLPSFLLCKEHTLSSQKCFRISNLQTLTDRVRLISAWQTVLKGYHRFEQLMIIWLSPIAIHLVSYCCRASLVSCKPHRDFKEEIVGENIQFFGQSLFLHSHGNLTCNLFAKSRSDHSSEQAIKREHDKARYEDPKSPWLSALTMNCNEQLVLNKRKNTQRVFSPSFPANTMRVNETLSKWTKPLNSTSHGMKNQSNNPTELLKAVCLNGI